jgi:hypothetical protein
MATPPRSAKELMRLEMSIGVKLAPELSFV